MHSVNAKRILGAALVCLSLGMSGVSWAHYNNDDDVAGAEQLDAAFAAAMNANDPSAFANLYANDAVLFNIAGEPAYGREAISAALAGFLGAFTVSDFHFTESHYVSSDNLSTGYALFTATLTPKGASYSFPLSGRSTVIAKRIHGVWRYVHDHASLPQP